MKYKTIFSNLKGTVNTETGTEIDTEIDAEPDAEFEGYFYPMIIDGVIIETDGFEALTIDRPEKYSKNQLDRFDYDTIYPCEDKEEKLLVLKNYQLKTFIPIRVLETGSNKKMTAEIQITMNHEGGEEEGKGKGVKRTCSLLGKTINLGTNFGDPDLEEAFAQLQKQLAGQYCMETCSNCRNSFWNPYGGSDFFNHLCFKSESKAFQAIANKGKESVIDFIKYDNEQNWRTVRLTDYCNEFEPR
jgi:hypothetical protein